MKVNQNAKTILAISIAAVFSMSVVATSGIPQATAEKFQNPDFESNDCIVTGFAEANYPNYEDLECEMKAWLQENGKHLKYQIKISGMELKDTNSDPADDVDGIHIHKMTNDDFTNPKGPHQLNIFGHPGVDDASNVAIPKKGIVKGIWDDKDENLSYSEPDNSHKLSDNLGLLCEGKVFSAVHGQLEDDPITGHKAPYMKIVFEPTEKGLQLCEKLGY